MQNIIAFSLKQRVLYNLLFVTMIVVGIFTLFSLPTERYPNFSLGEVNIFTTYPGASPEEVESLVTRKIEEAIEMVDDVEWINSSSFSGSSNVHLKFVDDADYERLFNDVRFRVMNIINELPEGIDPPELSNIKVQEWLPVITVNLVGNHSNRTLSLMGEEIKTRILTIPDVQQVQFSGRQTQEFHVLIDPKKLRQFGVSFEQVSQALISANHAIPAGKFADHSGEFMVKMDERFTSLEQVQNCVVRRDADGSLLRIIDLSTKIGMEYRDPVSLASVNGMPSVGLKVIKSDLGSSIKIRDQVREVIDEYRPILKAQGVDLIITQDTSVYINDGLNILGMNLLVGIILVSLILWYFAGTRNAGLVTIGIPFAFLTTLVLMKLTGNSLNEITLFCFVLVSGVVVDDAIVVTENIYRHIQKGQTLTKAIIKGTAEVATPVISATLTTIAAFIPLFIMTGSLGQFFALIPKAVTFAVIASLIECLLILPIHYYSFGPRSSNKTNLIESDNAVLRIVRDYTKWLLNKTMRHRGMTLGVVTAMFFLSLVIMVLSFSGKFPLVDIQYFPDDYKVYYVDIVAPSNTPIEAVDKKVKEIAVNIVKDGPGMASSAAGLAGMYFSDDYEPIYGNNFGSVIVTMPSADDQEFDNPMLHLEAMRKRLEKAYEKDGYKLHIHPQTDGPPRGKDINIRITGENIKTVSGLAEEILKYMKASADIGPHLIDLHDDRGTPKRVFRLEVDQDRVAEFGLDNNQVASLAASVLDGRYLGKYRHIDDEVDLKLRIDPGVLPNPEAALYIPVVEQAGRPIYLADLVKVRAYNETGKLNRYQLQRAISLKADIHKGAPASISSVANQVRNYYETIRHKYIGATLTFGGEHEDTRRSFESLINAFMIAILMMYILLATQFQSYLQPFIVLFAIVFALIGVVFGTLISHTVFTVNSFVAMIGVAGVVVNDALVLIDFINKRYRSGIPRRKAIIVGVHIRLRPILLTTLTTSLGLLPMAIGFPSYSVIWGSMAMTFVTGLATATFLTLFVIPPLWDLMQDFQEQLDVYLKSSPIKQSKKIPQAVRVTEAE
ncbi:MAG: efflux RND transporter permease subunit [Candidatus Thiodiazotropha taylori]|nr:efflux RND transporter permease subunit [Candidatus Thiodiazotropha taylori]